MNTIISNKVHHYSLLLELDDEMKDWFENQLDKGKYLQHLIAEDRERQNYPETDELNVQPEHKRTAGDYTIIHVVHVGDREVVVGENPAGAKGEKYMCGFCQQNELFARYEEILVSDDFPEIMGIFGKRVAEQAEKTRVALLTPKIQGIQDMPLTAEHCTLISHDDDINDKLVVINPDVLRREYRKATHQIKLCVGGFGASPHSRGSACYCVDLYTGKTSRYERRDVLGTLKREQLPKWAELGLVQYEQEHHQKQPKTKEER